MKHVNYETYTPFSQNDAADGKAGEDYVIRNALALFGCRVKKDLRGEHIEGELLLENNKLVEVKADYTEYPNRRGTVSVEMQGNKESSPGWYQYCDENGVDYVVWTCYWAEAKHCPKDHQPYGILCVPMDTLKYVIDVQKKYRPCCGGHLYSIRIDDICCTRDPRIQTVFSYPPNLLIFNRTNVFEQLYDEIQQFLPEGLSVDKRPAQILFNNRSFIPDEE